MASKGEYLGRCLIVCLCSSRAGHLLWEQITRFVNTAGDDLSSFEVERLETGDPYALTSNLGRSTEVLTTLKGIRRTWPDFDHYWIIGARTVMNFANPLAFFSRMSKYSEDILAFDCKLDPLTDRLVSVSTDMMRVSAAALDALLSSRDSDAESEPPNTQTVGAAVADFIRDHKLSHGDLSSLRPDTVGRSYSGAWILSSRDAVLTPYTAKVYAPVFDPEEVFDYALTAITESRALLFDETFALSVERALLAPGQSARATDFLNRVQQMRQSVPLQTPFDLKAPADIVGPVLVPGHFSSTEDYLTHLIWSALKKKAFRAARQLSHDLDLSSLTSADLAYEMGCAAAYCRLPEEAAAAFRRSIDLRPASTRKIAWLSLLDTVPGTDMTGTDQVLVEAIQRSGPHAPYFRAIKRQIIPEDQQAHAPKRLIICGTQRCGSTIVLDDMRQTGVLGQPEEYFIPFDPANERADWDARFRAILARGTSENGVFSVKIMADQLEKIEGCLAPAVPNQAAQKGPLFPHLTGKLKGSVFIVIKRQNIIRQAVSRVIARQTGVNHAVRESGDTLFAGNRLKGDKDTYNAQAVYDAQAIEKEISNIRRENSLWEKFFMSNGIEPLRLTYEDLAAGPETYLHDLAGRVDISLPKTLPERSIQRLSNQVNEDWTKRYLADQGPVDPSGFSSEQ